MKGVTYTRPDMPTPRVRAEAFRVSAWSVVFGWLAVKTGRAVWWLLRQPLAWLTGVPVAVCLYVWQAYGLLPVAYLLLGVASALFTWRIAHAASYRWAVGWRVRAWWRRLVVYGGQWDRLMTVTGLDSVDRRRELLVPKLGRVRCTATLDRVRVRMLPGQVLDDYADKAHRFAATFGALDCRVRSTHRRIRRPGKAGKVVTRVLDLWFLVTDPLSEPVPLFAIPERPKLRALPVALREDGLVWTLQLLATHVLVAGITGAGKGSVLWSIIRALAAAVRDGLVELWVVDPKGGMELAAGQPLFARYCYGDDTPDTPEGERRVFELAFAEFLEDAVAVMRDRQQRLRGRTRTHKPAPGDPLIVLVIDELASLTAYVTDRKARERIKNAHALLLSQGRACGVVVVSALQDPRKDVLPDRNLYPTRIALRLAEPEDADLVLGKDARKRGARCDEISDDTPGVGFVVVEDQPEPVRLRFAYVDDAEVYRLAHSYAPGEQPEPAALPYPDEPPAGEAVWT